MPFDSTEIFKFPKLETDSWYWFSNKKITVIFTLFFICSHAIHWIQEIKKDVYFKHVRQDRKIKFDLFHTRYLLTDVLLKSLELLTYDFDILKECVSLSLIVCNSDNGEIVFVCVLDWRRSVGHFLTLFPNILCLISTKKAIKVFWYCVWGW